MVGAVSQVDLMKYFLLLVTVALLVGCEGINQEAIRYQAMNDAIRQEAPGDYFVGRRMHKRDYKMWGWVREPGKHWKTSRLVMLNEQRKLAPDRAANKIGSDNNHEYRLEGFFSGETVYEPASNRFYPEFVLTGYKLLSSDPPNIYEQRRQNKPEVRILQAPR